jgi:predicted membrane chloride channel (bestrophin family)
MFGNDKSEKAKKLERSYEKTLDLQNKEALEKLNPFKKLGELLESEEQSEPVMPERQPTGEMLKTLPSQDAIINQNRELEKAQMMELQRELNSLQNSAASMYPEVQRRIKQIKLKLANFK